jgi:hypothetical protein
MEYSSRDVTIVVSILLLGIIALISISLERVVALQPSNVIFPNSSSFHGSTYKQWVENWWKWWIGIPNSIHPYHFHNSAACSANQTGPVWFLPSITANEGLVTYECNIPAGKDIMLRLTSTECEIGTGGVEKLTTDRELDDCVRNILTTKDYMVVTFDGESVNLNNLGPLIETDYFNVVYKKDPTDQWGKVDPGSYRAKATGFFLFLHDLSPGKHTIYSKVVDRLTMEDEPGKVKFEPSEGIYNIYIQ